MSLKDEIINNKDLEPLFLIYIKYSLLMQELDEYSNSMSEDKRLKGLNILNKQVSSSNNLTQKLKNEYNLEFNDHSSMPLFNEICEYYFEKYTEEKIRIMPDSDIESSEKKLMLHNDKCGKCGTPRVEITFDELPKEMQNDLMDMLEMVDYFLFCPNCKEYGIIFNL